MNSILIWRRSCTGWQTIWITGNNTAMGIALQLKSGPLAGQIVTIRMGQPFVIGRTPDRAQFAVPHDKEMSGAHFAVECDEKGCHLRDLKSSNGTFLNGARAKEAALANGDEIKSGQTIFVVRIVPGNPLPGIPDSPQATVQPQARTRKEMPSAPPPQIRPPVAPIATPALQARPGQPSLAPSAGAPIPAVISAPRPSEPPALVIGSWTFQKIPDGWKIQEGLGIQQIVKDAFPATIGVMEEPLGPGLTLQHYVDAHTKMFREYLHDLKIDVASPPAIRGSEETVVLEIRYSLKDGPPIYYRRVYARCGFLIGVLTLTTLEKNLPSVRPLYDSVLSGFTFTRKN
jgi:pSer/pThr/pTyr-binding forkhead associated (FHA) protein